MDLWRDEKRRGVWLRIPIESSVLIPVAVSEGFWFHHSSPSYLMMCNWLPGGKEKSRLPHAASHYIGVAGFVMNSKSELLVVQEKNGPVSGTNLWKVPGGLCDLGEDISSAAIREVREETGLDCTFSCVSSLIEFHSGRGPSRESASDMYCLAVLRANDESQLLIPQPEEIEKVAWMPINDLLSIPFFGPSTVFGKAYRAALHASSSGQTKPDVQIFSGHSVGLSGGICPIGFGNRKASILHSTYPSPPPVE